MVGTPSSSGGHTANILEKVRNVFWELLPRLSNGCNSWKCYQLPVTEDMGVDMGSVCQYQVCYILFAANALSCHHLLL